MKGWLAAEEALARLGVRPQTLYAYVSRGRIRAQADPGDPRRSLYAAADIAALGARKARGRAAASVAADAMAWGEPVLVSAITTVAEGRLYYRGRDAAALALTETFEGVARLLRGVDAPPLESRLRPAPPRTSSPRSRLFQALAAQAAAAAPSSQRSVQSLAAEAATLLDVAADAVIGRAEGGAIHERLAQAWSCGPQGADLIRRALVLMADHELNPSTFAARVAASTGASLAACVLAGLATLSGPLHGGAAEAVARLAEEAGRLGPEAEVVTRLAHWTSTPGFGHPLYPDGDPRARALLTQFRAPAGHARLRAAVAAADGEADNLDFAISAMAQALDLPPDAPFLLFAVARTAGWLAHAIEQASSGERLRPRARYVGPTPGDQPGD